jgi:DNA-binding winged helix-turn-helix (wHTH) protein
MPKSILINGRRVKMNNTAAALLACLQTHSGSVVRYERLVRILGHRTTRSAQLHLLRQYMLEVRKALAACRSRYVVAVVLGVGYALCPVTR